MCLFQLQRNLYIAETEICGTLAMRYAFISAKGIASWFSFLSSQLHCFFKGDILEDPANEPKKDMYMMTVDPEDAPNQPE